VFSGDSLMLDPALQPLPRSAFPKGVAAIEGLTLYRLPDPERVYLLGADVAQGLLRGDASCCVVLDAHDRPCGGRAAAAPNGRHDDRVIALAIAWQMRKGLRRYRGARTVHVEGLGLGGAARLRGRAAAPQGARGHHNRAQPVAARPTATSRRSA
jgi:hypothetical protein